MKILFNKDDEVIQKINDGDYVEEITKEIPERPEQGMGEELYLKYDKNTKSLVWHKRLRPLTPEEEIMVLNQTVQELLIAQQTAALGGVPNGQVD